MTSANIGLSSTPPVGQARRLWACQSRRGKTKTPEGGSCEALRIERSRILAFGTALAALSTFIMAHVPVALLPGAPLVVAVRPPRPGCPVNPLYQAPSPKVQACRCPHNRQLVWQMEGYIHRLSPAAINTDFHRALLRGLNSIAAAQGLVHLGNYRGVVWVNRSGEGRYVWRVVEAALSSLRHKQHLPPCVRQFPHNHPGE